MNSYYPATSPVIPPMRTENIGSTPSATFPRHENSRENSERTEKQKKGPRHTKNATRQDQDIQRTNKLSFPQSILISRSGPPDKESLAAKSCGSPETWFKYPAQRVFFPVVSARSQKQKKTPATRCVSRIAAPEPPVARNYCTRV